MASIFCLAQMCQAVYDVGGQVPGWGRVRDYGSGPAGYSAALFTRRREVVFAIRGTDGGDKDVGDFFADAQIFLGDRPYQSFAANADVARIRRQYQGRTIILTGHSLGGALATLAGARHRLPVVTFNAPGVARSYIKATPLGPIGWLLVDRSRMIHVRTILDPVSVATGPQLGMMRIRNVSSGGQCAPHDALCHHAIRTIVNSLDRPEFKKELEF